MIYTFYSYKGGVGRSMALANVAEQMAQAGLRVLMIDWDLEAPGLERFFDIDGEEVRSKPGLLDMLLRYKERMGGDEGAEEALFEDVRSYVIEIDANRPSTDRGTLFLLSAGKRGDEEFADYAATVRTFDWTDFYEHWEGELFFAKLREQCEGIADVVLIDSRTGVTEMGGVGTYQLADVVVMLCGASQQSLDGTHDLALDFTRPEVSEIRGRPLALLIVPARLENAETDQLDRFKKEFLRRFEPFVPEQFGRGATAFWELGIPYVPYYAFTEKLAVKETRAGAEAMRAAFTNLSQRMIELDPKAVFKRRQTSATAGAPILRIFQSPTDDGRSKVELSFDEGRVARQMAVAVVDAALLDEDREDLRWYFEDYLQLTSDPAPKIAARIERRMTEIGQRLFEAVFTSSDDARDLWARIRNRLPEVRIEIISNSRDAATVPWELIRDPKSDMPLALRAAAFVRCSYQPSVTGRPPMRGGGPIRILVVISRPGGADDVPYRSVATRLLRAVSGVEPFRVDVLRPPTFERLMQVLRSAARSGEPYHVVQFDGHAVMDTSSDRRGPRNCLLFENPSAPENARLVDGSEIGLLLAETDVPVLMLNSCRSAHEEALALPEEECLAAPASQARAFGSLAQMVLDSGVPGVVAMGYNVYVITAARFVAGLYQALAEGQPLGEAVTAARKELAAQPLREIANEPRELQDWAVPVVYEAYPLTLLPAASRRDGLKISIAAEAATLPSGAISPELQRKPDVGFFGRDDVLLALDRAFDTNSVALLHGYAGGGKSAVAAEFARWYHLTGGIDGPALYTSFERHKPLTAVLNETIGRVFQEALEGAGVDWLVLTGDQRREVALQVLTQVPVLWVWDSIEPIAGFPAGTQSAWAPEEQRELADFLRAAAQTKAKFLLTSRRDEREWLGDFPVRITMPPMPMQERAQLARALAERQGRRFAEIVDWTPLLRFSAGNPLVLTVLVAHALQSGLRTRREIETLVEQLRRGEAGFDDEAGEGREHSLGASLRYGLEHAFTEEERARLALLSLFQGFVDADVLAFMSSGRLLRQPRYSVRDAKLQSAVFVPRAINLAGQSADGGKIRSSTPSAGENANVPAPGRELGEESSGELSLDHFVQPFAELGGMTREAWVVLLDRAAEVGILTAHGQGYYSTHPALTWFWKELFDRHYVQHGLEPEMLRSFAESMGAVGNAYHDAYGNGMREVVSLLGHEEGNLLQARSLGRKHEWWTAVMTAMQGLRVLYEHTGRRTEWANLVQEIVPHFVDPQSDGPIAGREEMWGLVTEYRSQLARDARDWPEAARLQRIRIQWELLQTQSFRNLGLATLDGAQREALRSLAVALQQLGHTLRQGSDAECVAVYQEAIALFESIDDRAGIAATAFNLGHALAGLPSIRDLDGAERWYRRSLEVRDERDTIGRARCLAQLGYVAVRRLEEARSAGKPEEELRGWNTTALELYHRALEQFPRDALNDLDVVHHQIGNAYATSGDPEKALQHWREAIRLAEMQGDPFSAAQSRLNIAFALTQSGRLADAREYAVAALRNFEAFGDRTADEVQRTVRVIETIDAAQREER